jgi:hypothetical protein
MTWRDESLSMRLHRMVVAAIDASPLLLPVLGAEVGSVYWQAENGAMITKPAVTIVLCPKGGSMPARTSVMAGWGMTEGAVRRHVWAELDNLAGHLADQLPGDSTGH